jgi:integrase
MMSLHDQAGGRKYLTREEHIRFLLAADQAPRDVRAFCHTLGWSGCRISEALALTAERVDVAAGTIAFETLKKRQRGLFRTVPIPPELAVMLDLVFGLRGLKGPAAKAPLPIGRPAHQAVGQRGQTGLVRRRLLARLRRRPGPGDRQGAERDLRHLRRRRLLGRRQHRHLGKGAGARLALAQQEHQHP